MGERRLLERRGDADRRPESKKAGIMAKSTKNKRAAAKTEGARKAKGKATRKAKSLKTAASKRKRAASAKGRPVKRKTRPKARAKPKAKAAPKRKVRSQAKVFAPAREAPERQPRSLLERIEALKPQTGRDWSETLFLPETDFPMRAGLPEREPELLNRWEKLGLYDRLREDAHGRETFVLHDGPPYANANIHIGTGLNKILKDVVVRSQQMMGKDANYVPGWDCHGLPIEWKVEEENYRAKGKAKPDLSNPDALIGFRAECRAYAEHWLGVQRDELRRRGRLEAPLHDHGLRRRSDNRRGAHEVRHERAALSRLKAGHVVRGRAHRARRGRGRIRGDRESVDLCEVSRAELCPTRIGHRRDQRRLNRHLDDDAMDDPWQPRRRLLEGHRLRPLRGHAGARRQLGQDRRQADPC